MIENVYQKFRYCIKKLGYIGGYIWVYLVNKELLKQKNPRKTMKIKRTLNEGMRKKDQ